MKQAVEHLRLQAEDPFRKLPSETTGEAVRGDEMGLCWYGYDTVTGKDRIAAAESVSVFRKEGNEGKDWKLISEENAAGRLWKRPSVRLIRNASLEGNIRWSWTGRSAASS